MEGMTKRDAATKDCIPQLSSTKKKLYEQRCDTLRKETVHLWGLCNIHVPGNGLGFERL